MIKMSRHPFIKTACFVLFFLCLSFIFLTGIMKGPFGDAVPFWFTGLPAVLGGLITALLVSRRLTRTVFSDPQPHVARGLPLLLFCFTLGCSWTWLENRPFRIDRVSLPAKDRIHIIQDESGTNVQQDHFSSVSINIRSNMKTVWELIKRPLLNLPVVFILS